MLQVIHTGDDDDGNFLEWSLYMLVCCGLQESFVFMSWETAHRVTSYSVTSERSLFTLCRSSPGYTVAHRRTCSPHPTCLSFSHRPNCDYVISITFS